MKKYTLYDRKTQKPITNNLSNNLPDETMKGGHKIIAPLFPPVVPQPLLNPYDNSIQIIQPNLPTFNQGINFYPQPVRLGAKINLPTYQNMSLNYLNVDPSNTRSEITVTSPNKDLSITIKGSNSEIEKLLNKAYQI